AAGPGDVGRGLVTGHKTLVAVDGRGVEQAALLGILEDAGDVLLGGPGEEGRVIAVRHGILAILPQRLVHVHAAAVAAEDRLRHEGGVGTVAGGDGLDDVFIGD